MSSGDEQDKPDGSNNYFMWVAGLYFGGFVVAAFLEINKLIRFNSTASEILIFIYYPILALFDQFPIARERLKDMLQF